MMNAEPGLGTYFQLRQAQKHVEGIGHPAVGGIFQGDDAEIGMAAIDLLEYGSDAADADEFDGLTEAIDGGQMAETVLRPQVSNLEHLLKGPRAAHDFAEDGLDGLFVQRPFI